LECTHAVVGLVRGTGQSEHILGMSSFAFGILLIVAGFVAYAVNLLLKPQGWGSVVEDSVQPIS